MTSEILKEGIPQSANQEDVSRGLKLSTKSPWHRKVWTDLTADSVSSEVASLREQMAVLDERIASFPVHREIPAVQEDPIGEELIEGSFPEQGFHARARMGNGFSKEQQFTGKYVSARNRKRK